MVKFDFISLRRKFAGAYIPSFALRLSQGFHLAASIIVTTCHRATYLNLMLASLDRQFFPVDCYEIILADNASQDDTPVVLNAYERRNRMRIKRLRSANRCGRAVLLNNALEAAQGKILVFLHDDRLVQPDFLLQHLLLQWKEPCVALGDDHRCIHTHLFAPGEPEMNGAAPNPFLTPQDLDDPKRSASLVFPGENNYASLFAYYEQQRQPLPHPWALFSTANASVPREAIERVGGFDEYFSGWGLDDLAYRLHQAGLPFRYVPKAVTLRQLRPERRENPPDLHHDITHFLAKHPHLTDIERALIRRGSYVAP